MVAATHRTSVPDYRVSSTVETVYLALVIGGGQVLIPILLVLCCVRGLARHPTLVNFLASWILYSLATCFLLYSGHAYEARPPTELCLVQVPLQQAAFLVVAFSALSLVLQLRFTLPTVSLGTKQSVIRDIILVLFPYVVGGVYVAVFFAVYATASKATMVERGRFTCRLVDQPSTAVFSKFVPITIGVVLLLCLFMSVWMLKKTVKRLLNVRDWTLKDSLNVPTQTVWLPILTRFALFCIYAALTILACLVVAAFPQGIGRTIVDWYTASLPIAAFLIFAPWPKPREKEDDSSPIKTINLPFMSPTATLVGDDFESKKKEKVQTQSQSQVQGVVDESPDSFYGDEYFDVAITPVRPLTRPESIYRPTRHAPMPPAAQTLNAYQPPQSFNVYATEPTAVPILRQPSARASHGRGNNRPSWPEHNPYATHVPARQVQYGNRI